MTCKYDVNCYLGHYIEFSRLVLTKKKNKKSITTSNLELNNNGLTNWSKSFFSSRNALNDWFWCNNRYSNSVAESVDAFLHKDM